VLAQFNSVILVSAVVICYWESTWSSIFQPKYFCSDIF